MLTTREFFSYVFQVDSNDPNLKLIPVVYSCDSANQDKWITTVYVVKGILLFYGLFLAYETRNVHYEHLNDSRMIGVSVYNCVVMSLLGGISRIVLSLNFYELSYGITVTCIIFPSLGTLFLIFLPKVRYSFFLDCKRLRYDKKYDQVRSYAVGITDC